MHIQRHDLRIGQRNLHYRRAGRGPALVLLHQSPQSGAALQPLIETLATRYTVFAPDTPGFGDSDPLPQPDIDTLGAALNEALDALRIRQCGLYGVHTGALIALAATLAAPARIAHLVLDGYALFTAAEREELLAHYLPANPPHWSGQHLAWYWARMREQLIHWPWHAQRAQNRTTYALPSARQTDQSMRELLRVGDAYRDGYRAAFAWTGRDRIAELRVSAELLYRSDDVLAPHRQRLPALADGVQVRELASAADSILNAVAQSFDAALERRPWPLHSAPSPTPAEAWSMCSVDGVQLRRHRRGTRRLGEPVWLCLHAPLRSAASVLSALPETAAVDTIDLPNHGASDSVPANAVEAVLLRYVEQELGEHPLAILAFGGTAGCAVRLARRCTSRMHKLWLVEPWQLGHGERKAWLSGVPSMDAQAGGGHWLALWQWLREQQLYWPWGAPERRLDGEYAVEILQQRLVEAMQVRPDLKQALAAALGRPWRRELQKLQGEICVWRSDSVASPGADERLPTRVELRAPLPEWRGMAW